MVAKEQIFGVIFPLYSREPLIIFAPKLLLPVRLEIVRLIDITSGTRCGVANKLHRCRYSSPRGLPLGLVGLMARHARVARCAGSHDDQSCCLEDRRSEEHTPDLPSRSD